MTGAARIAVLVAGMGGIGRASRAPGTVASAAAVAVGLLLPPLALLLAALFATAAGVAALRRLGPEVTHADPGWVVIDEVAGQWLAMLGVIGVTPRWQAAVAAFVLFRVLDIAKPGPIGWIDRRRGAWAIMGDDVLAGLSAALILTAWLRR